MSQKNIHRAMQEGYGECAIDKIYSGPLHRHHINGRDIPLYNKPGNVVYLSPNIHSLVHEGRIVIEGWYITSEGKQLIWHHKTHDSITGNNSNTHIILRK